MYIPGSCLGPLPCFMLAVSQRPVVSSTPGCPWNNDVTQAVSGLCCLYGVGHLPNE